MNSFQSIFQRRRTITLPAGQTHQFICNIYGFFIGNIPGQGGSQLFHLRRVGVCRSLILNKQQNGQNFSPGVLGTACSLGTETSRG